MLLNSALTLDILREKQLRVDLFDTDRTNLRWSDQALNREIDRSVDRYSQVAPYMALVQIPTIQGSRIYPRPAGAWWVERVEYPFGSWPKLYCTFKERISPLIAAPSLSGGTSLNGSPMTAAPSGAGPLTGVYQYAVTFVVPGGGETVPSPTLAITLAGNRCQLSGVPIGPYGVSSRNLYRTTAGGAQLKLLATLPDNSTSSYLDSVADGSLGVNAPTANTTADIPQFEIWQQNYQVPQNSSDLIEVTTAQKHLLDATGTSIPESHWDAITLGAASFAVTSYVANVNDNFDYVDGQFRDRVDDTKSAVAWAAYGQELHQRWQDRLAAIRNQQEAYTPAIPQWGDKPVRWDRL